MNFAEVWCVDFEFIAHPGDRPKPVCLVARELYSGRVIRVWEDRLHQTRNPPYSVGADSLFVAYYASAEFGCHLALGWPMPARVLDLYDEFRWLTSGLKLPCGRGLLGALVSFGISGIDCAEKESMRSLVLRGGPWSEREKGQILDYCESDVTALIALLPKMLPSIDLPRALLRGRYMAAAARMEWTGIPMDVKSLKRLRNGWPSIKSGLIRSIDAGHGIYCGQSFRQDKWRQFVTEREIPWPRLESGALELTDDTFRQMAKIYPEVAPYQELRHALSQMRLEELSIGPDARNRCILSAFASRTGRNQPSNTKYIFGPAVWLRSLIRPEPNIALAYVDYEQQEFGIAAALSGDPAMLEAYRTGDPYLAFAVQANAAPATATKQSHGPIREQFKACALGVQYGMGEIALAERIGKSRLEARDLLRLHRKTYPRFWAWSDSAVDYACLRNRLFTVFGWQVLVGPEINPRSLRNFPMQANGAEMLRLACCLATERGIKVCAPIHDAVLIEAASNTINDEVARTRAAMAEASKIVLGGLELRTDVKIVRYPERYCDPRGEEMWQKVMQLLDELENSSGGGCLR